MVGVGFFTYFEIPEDVPDAPVRAGVLQFGDVIAEIDGLERGAGFLIWIRDRRLHFLEGYAYDEPWPKQAGRFRLSYAKPDRSEVLAGLGLKD